MSERRLSLLLASLTAFVIVLVMFDVTRRSARRDEPAVDPVAPPDSTLAVPAPLDLYPGPAADIQPTPPPPVEGGSGQELGPTEESGSTDAAGTSYMEALGRADARRQIRGSAAVTYLNHIVLARGDSMLHRWDGRYDRPVRVYLPATSPVANFQPGFLDVVRGAFRTWEGIGLGVRFDLAGDSADADVRFVWRPQFEIERSGQTDLGWGQDGRIREARVTLATFDPKGRAMGATEIRVVALHEIGHLLGLDHSPDSTDLMYPEPRVRELSRRDIATARLLYRLSPGTLR